MKGKTLISHPFKLHGMKLMMLNARQLTRPKIISINRGKTEVEQLPKLRKNETNNATANTASTTNTTKPVNTQSGGDNKQFSDTNVQGGYDVSNIESNVKPGVWDNVQDEMVKDDFEVDDNTDSQQVSGSVKTDGGLGPVETFEDMGIYVRPDLIIKTNGILYRKETFTPYIQTIVTKVVELYATHVKSRLLPDKFNNIHKYLNHVLETREINYNELMKAFKAQSNEHFFSYMLLAYHDKAIDLMLRTVYTFGRMLPFDSSTEWFDNYRLNTYGNAWNMIMWKQFNTNDTYVLNKDIEIKPINNKVTLNWRRIIKFMIGSLRAFMITHGFVPGVTWKLKDGKKKLEGGAGDTSFSEDWYKRNVELFEKIIGDSLDSDPLSIYTVCGISGSDPEVEDLLMQVCDEAYLHFPFYYGGCHGCDVFRMCETSLSVQEIRQFLNRYPSAHVGYILNNKTYASGSGEHWMALEFTHTQAKLICSQGTPFDTAFQDGGVLLESIKRYHFGMRWNETTIQTDNCNCGLYSALALFELLEYADIEDNVKQVVEAIGVNMTNFGKNIGKETDAPKLRGKTAGTK